MNNDETPERVRVLLEECAELFAAIRKPKQEVRQESGNSIVKKVETIQNTATPVIDVPLPPHIASFLKEQLPEQTNLAELIQRLLGEDADTTSPEEKKRKMYQRLVEVIFNKLSEDKVMQKEFGQTIAQQLEIVNLLNAGKE